jgi:hypothetical protein
MIWLFIVITACVAALAALLAHKVHELRRGEPHDVVHGVRNYADVALGGAYRRVSRIVKQSLRGIGIGIVSAFRHLPRALTVLGHRLTAFAIDAWHASGRLARALGHRIAPRKHRRDPRENDSDIV